MHPLLLIVLYLALIALPVAANAGPRQETVVGPLSGDVLSVQDGDTLNVSMHVWIGQKIETAVRIAGIDTPELKAKCDKERKLAIDARAELSSLVRSGKVILSSIKLEKYAGRVLANATTTNGIDIATHLINKGFARPYQGKKRVGWCQ